MFGYPKCTSVGTGLWGKAGKARPTAGISGRMAGYLRGRAPLAARGPLGRSTAPQDWPTAEAPDGGGLEFGFTTMVWVG